MHPQVDAIPARPKRQQHLSKDRLWRSFPKVPHLLQYVPNGNYYGRIKVDGKILRKSLETDTWTKAKLRLTDFVQKHQGVRNPGSAPKFSAAVELFKRDLDTKTRLKPGSKRYRLICLQNLEQTWPGLWELGLDQISEQDCKDWAARLSGQNTSPSYFNNTVGTLRMVLRAGIKAHKEKSGVRLEDPAAELQRVRVKQKHLQLPEPSQFKSLVETLRQYEGQGPDWGDLVEFLAYSGLRIQSEAIWVNWEDIDGGRKEIIVRGHPETGTKNSEIRRVPIIGDMEKLLIRLKEKAGNATGRVLRIGQCAKALVSACGKVGVSRLTHHDLRHLFATRCIESGVDIPTVARWLGHKDGGALAMRTYGHLRNEHSQAMAQKVKF
ncbi:MAG: tyrosine-type recombinase/integrase [Limisphaerales bacterium]